MFQVDYTCPDCGHAWQENNECACDSDCPKCGARNLTAVAWAELKPYTVILSLDEWEDFSFFHAMATDPRAAVISVLIADLDLFDPDDPDHGYAIGRVKDVSVVPGTISEVYGLDALKPPAPEVAD